MLLGPSAGVKPAAQSGMPQQPVDSAGFLFLKAMTKMQMKSFEAVRWPTCLCKEQAYVTREPPHGSSKCQSTFAQT